MDERTEKRLEDYALGKSSPAEQAALRQEANQDETLAAALRRTELEVRAMQLADRDDLRRKMATWQLAESSDTAETEAPSKIVPLRRRWRRALAYAASVLVLLSAGTFWYANQYYGNARLAEEFFISGLSTSRGDTATPSELDRAKTAMAAGDWAAVPEILAATETVPARFLVAEAYRQLENYDAALAQYDLNIATGSPLQQEEAEFFRVLTLLAAGRTEAARAELDRFGADHAFAPQIEELRQKLNSGWRAFTF